MQKYINQLLQRLKKAAKDLPKNYPYAMDYSLEEGREWVAELAKVPYKPLEEWVGVQQIEFPDTEKLTEVQMAALIKGMDEVLDAYNFDYDCKEELANNGFLHYRVLVQIWTESVQYLPQAGFDIDICGGEEGKCWLKHHCFCLYDPPYLTADEPPLTNEEEPKNDNDLPF